jgi:hypothetical protein
MRKTLSATLVAGIAVTVMTTTLRAASVTVPVSLRDMAVGNSERGNFYVFAVRPPANVEKALDRVFLEFVVNVNNNPSDELVPCSVGVFPLTTEFNGGNPSFESLVPSVRLVPTGGTRRVMMDITKIVLAWNSNPASNHGVVLGPLTGPQVSGLTLQGGALGPDIAARITFFYQNHRRAPAGTRTN